MSERYDTPDRYPRLLPSEVRSLAEWAILHGRISDVDYPEEQMVSRPRPHSFILRVDPEPFKKLIQEWLHGGVETVTSVEIEYDDARVLDVGEPLVSPVVYVSMSSIIYDATDSSFSISKEVVYTLPLAADEGVYVKESYSEDRRGRYDFLKGEFRETLEMMADEIRPLSQQDVDLLRHLVSQR